MRTKLTLEQFCKLFRCTVEQANNLKAKNKIQLEAMYREACETGKPVNNYTGNQLRQLINGLDVRNS